VYVEKEHPVDIEKKIQQKKDWREIVGERSSQPRRTAEPIPGPSSQQPPEEPPAEEEDPIDSEEEVQDSLNPNDSEGALIARLCWEGGVESQNFLISKAVSLNCQREEPKRMEIPGYHKHTQGDSRRMEDSL